MSFIKLLLSIILTFYCSPVILTQLRDMRYSTEAWVECQLDIGVSRAEANELRQHPIPPNRKMACFAACYLKKMLVITDDNKFNLDITIDYIRRGGTQNVDKVIQVATECTNKVNNLSEINWCELTREYITCCVLVAEQMGFKDPEHII